MPNQAKTRQRPCSRKPKQRLLVPMTAEADSRPHSTGSDERNPNPNSGNSVRTNGIMAQWSAQAKDAVAPARSRRSCSGAAVLSATGTAAGGGKDTFDMIRHYQV